MKAIGESNHGNMYSWVKRKQITEEAGLKYICAQEFYITNSLEEKIRDNYHTILIARNLDGVKELNKLFSISYNKDGHFYYNPRISMDELINTTDNVIITTACLASPLWKGKDKDIYNKYIEFLINNKHRCFLEIQYHNVPEQIELNNNLYQLSQKNNLKLIVGTDTHALNDEHSEARKILLQAKKMQFTNEEEFDLTFKTYDELVEKFAQQNALPEKIYLEAIENTNYLADQIETFTIDKSHKYPIIEGDIEKTFKEEINKGYINKKIPHEKKNEYIKRIKEEYDVYKKLNTINYMLFQYDITSYARNNGVDPGPGRGSVNGSEIAYLLGITDMDSIKHNLNFIRFMNPDRVTLADIDIDYPPSRRQEVIDYVASKSNINFSEIITFNTIALRGAIREVGRALKYDYSIIDEIAKNIEENEDEEKKYRETYPELFKYVDLLNGTNISVGSHPSGFLVSPIPLQENIGIFYTSTSKYPVSQINMKELEECNYVKLDILGLANIEIINETCKLANIERLTPDNVNIEDDIVWEEIKQNPLGIFQFESNFAHSVLKNVLQAYSIIQAQSPDVKRIDLMSMANGALRPSGESFRDNLSQGIFNDNGHPGLNELLKDTMGYLIYQEQIMKFLVEFCGFSMIESDNVRRGLAKKVGTQEFLPMIQSGFIKTMKEKYNETEENSEKILQAFLQVISDASGYGFSLNHSSPYSYIGYINGFLRYYYPLEFITVMLNLNEDDLKKTSKIVEYANTRNIKIKSIQFGKSHAKYSPDKISNMIFKGIKSIKYCNENIAEELYQLGQNQYTSFLDLLIDIKNITSTDSRQIDILTRLQFFKEFGENQKLLEYIDYFDRFYNKKQIKKDKVDDHELFKKFSRETDKTYMDFQSKEYLQYIWLQIPDKSLPIEKQVKTEIEYLGYATTTYEVADDLVIITSLDTKYSPKIKAYYLATGQEMEYKIPKKIYKQAKFGQWDIIKVGQWEQRPKQRHIGDNQYEAIPGQFEKWILQYYVITKYNGED